jgi:hypothetical protein
MRKSLTCTLAVVIAIGAVWAAVAVAGGEKPVVVRAGNVILTVNGNASPTALPRNKLVPISFHASGKIATADGAHPPALDEVVLDVGKAGTIEAGAFPTCSAGQIEATTTEEAERVCRDAIVGSGQTEVEVQFPESSPFTAKGPLVIFNGGEKGGKSLMLIHAYVSVPAPTAIVTPVLTNKEHKGPYRLHSVTKIPLIAGGAGSVTGFYLSIDRKGYLTANCSNGHFSAHLTANFRDGTSVSGSFERPCTPID